MDTKLGAHDESSRLGTGAETQESYITKALAPMNSYDKYYKYDVSSNLNGLQIRTKRIEGKYESGTRPYSTKFIFEIPVSSSTGNLVDIKINSKITTTNDLTDNTRLTGIYLYSLLELYDKNRTKIGFSTPETLYSEIESMPFEKKRVIENACLDDVALNNTSAFVMTPFFSFFNQDTKNSIPAFVNNILRMEITTNSSFANMGFSAGITDIYPYVLAQYHWFPVNQYKIPKSINYLSYDYFVERPVVLSAASDFTVNLNCDKLLSKAYIFIKNASNAYLGIKEATIFKNNTEYAYKLSRDWNTYVEDSHHDSLGTMVFIDMGFGSNDTVNMGSLDMNSKNFYTLNVKTYANATTSDSLYVILKYRNVMYLNKKDEYCFEFARYDLNNY